MWRVGFGLVMAVGLSLVSAPEARAQDSGWWDWAAAAVGEIGQDVRYEREDRDDRYDRDRRERDRYDRDRRDRRRWERDRYDRSRRDRDGYDRRRPRHDRHRGVDRRPGGYVEVIIGGRRGGDRVYRRDRDRRRGNAPAFCRSGRGHPVHGWRWCHDRGWASYGRDHVSWRRHSGWGDVVLRVPRARYRHGAILDRSDLIYILGEAVFRQLAWELHLAHTDRVRGRWLTPGGRTGVLQIRSGSGPLAQLTDANGDGRVDAVLVPRR